MTTDEEIILIALLYDWKDDAVELESVLSFIRLHMENKEKKK